MISAKLMNALEKKGFFLNFPVYSSNEEMIIEILMENNQRLESAIPLLLIENIDYALFSKLTKECKMKLNKIIVATCKIFEKEGLENKHLKEIIKKNNLKIMISNEEYGYYLNSFKDARARLSENLETNFKERINLRSTLNTNTALSLIFSDGKLRIMDKIFRHEPLSNTELKYYYRAIRPLSRSILNENLQNYLRIIESVKKYKA